MQLVTSFFLPTFFLKKSHSSHPKCLVWRSAHPGRDAAGWSAEKSGPRWRGKPSEKWRIPWCFFSHWTVTFQVTWRFVSTTFRGWGPSNREEMSPKWEFNSDGKPPGGSDMSAPQSRGFFRFMKLCQTLIYEVAGGSDKLMMRFWVFLGFSGFCCADLSRGVWHPRSPGGALPCGKFGREAGPGEKAESKVHGKSHAPIIHPTHFRFCFFFRVVYNIVISVR